MATTIAIAVVLLAGCTVRTSEQSLSSWLKMTQTHRKFGGFDGTTETRYRVRYLGLWFDVDVTGASIVDESLAVVSLPEGGMGLLREGSRRPDPVCDRYGRFSMPPRSLRFDCLTANWRPDAAPGAAPTALTFVRRDARAAEVERREIALASDERTFAHGWRVVFYDDDDTPYFVAVGRAAASDYRVMPRNCALVAPLRGTSHLWIGPPEMTDAQCHDAKTWEAIVGRALYKAGEAAGRPRAPATRPRGPQISS